MIPARIRDAFKNVPEEVIDVCRPHPWARWIAPPAEGMRPIRDILVHMMATEGFWIGHVIHGEPRQRFDPETFGDPESLLAAWRPQRDATIAFTTGLTPEAFAGTRPYPGNQNARVSIEEIVWHVVTHEQYHRGQVFTRLALLGRRDLPDHDFLR